MSDGETEILLMYLGAGLSIASAFGLYGAKRSAEQIKEIRGAKEVRLGDPESLRSECVIVRGVASAQSKNDRILRPGFENDIYYRRKVIGRGIQIPWSPLVSLGLISLFSPQASGPFERPVSSTDEVAPNWGLRQSPASTSEFLRFPPNYVLRDSDLKKKKETDLQVAKPIYSAMASSVRYFYPYAHLVQELSLSSGDPVIAIGKIVRSESPVEGMPSYQLYNPTFSDRFALKPATCIVTTGTKEDVLNKLEDDAQKLNMYTMAGFGAGLLCFLASWKFSSKENRK